MEVFAFFVHKYLFHGPLWFLHKSHHQPRRDGLEWNDLFSLLFAGIAMTLILTGYWGGTNNNNHDHSPDARFFIGIGVTCYGLLYFSLHDWFIHNRYSKPFKSSNRYLVGIRNAHRIHHKSNDRVPSQEFGLLLPSNIQYFKIQDSMINHVTPPTNIKVE